MFFSAVSYCKKSWMRSEAACTRVPSHSGNQGNLENEFPIFQSGKTQRIWGKHQSSGKTQGICDSDPEGKGFRQFGVCASCAMCTSCVHWLHWLVIVAFVNITHLNEKVFLIEFWNFLQEISFQQSWDMYALLTKCGHWVCLESTVIHVQLASLVVSDDLHRIGSSQLLSLERIKRADQ